MRRTRLTIRAAAVVLTAGALAFPAHAKAGPSVSTSYAYATAPIQQHAGSCGVPQATPSIGTVGLVRTGFDMRITVNLKHADPNDTYSVSLWATPGLLINDCTTIGTPMGIDYVTTGPNGNGSRQFTDVNFYCPYLFCQSLSYFFVDVSDLGANDSTTVFLP